MWSSRPGSAVGMPRLPGPPPGWSSACGTSRTAPVTGTADWISSPGQSRASPPVYAVYDGYLTRQSDWTSTVIIRHPEDPLHPGKQVWTYYTHMATKEGEPFVSEKFPPGTREVFVPAGTLLGYQGNFSGDPVNPTGLHTAYLNRQR